MHDRHMGKQKSLSLGGFPEVDLKDAREKAELIRKQKREGLDPSLERKKSNWQQTSQAIQTFEYTAMEWYCQNKRTWSSSHASDVKRRLEKDIFPILGSRPLKDIETPELLEALRRIEKREAYDLTHRLLGVCGQIFRYGISTGRCTRDLSYDLRGALTPHVTQHQPVVRTEEFPKLIKSIKNYDQMGDLQTSLALQLLAHTFVRTCELIGARWEEFDLKHALWIIPDHRLKMKENHIVPISPQSMKLLEQAKNLAGGSDLAFPSGSYHKQRETTTRLFKV